MAMDLTAIVGESRENIKRTVTAVTHARMVRWVNWAQGYLADLHTYEEMREIYSGSTIASTSRYGFPDTMKDVYSMTLQDGSSSRVLTYVRARHFDTVIPRPAVYSEGRSDTYVDYGSNFQLCCIPDAAYSLVLRCSIYPTDFETDGTDDDEVSELLRKDALIVAMTTTFGFWMLKELEDAAYWGANLVPTLFDASLQTDHSAEDWIPIARGFNPGGSGGSGGLSGEWWSNPFTGRSL